MRAGPRHGDHRRRRAAGHLRPCRGWRHHLSGSAMWLAFIQRAAARAAARVPRADGQRGRRDRARELQAFSHEHDPARRSRCRCSPASCRRTIRRSHQGFSATTPSRSVRPIAPCAPCERAERCGVETRGGTRKNRSRPSTSALRRSPSARGRCAAALRAGGVACWGDTAYGKLGDGTAGYRLDAADVIFP